MVIVSDSETVVSRGEERQPAEKKAKKRAPRIPTIPRVRGLGTTGSNFSDNTSKYLGAFGTEVDLNNAQFFTGNPCQFSKCHSNAFKMSIENSVHSGC